MGIKLTTKLVYLPSHLPTVIYMDNKTQYTYIILLLFNLRSLLPANKIINVRESELGDLSFSDQARRSV